MSDETRGSEAASRGPTHGQAAPDPDMERARVLAHWLDDRFLDPLLGVLLPGAGDLLGSGAGLYIVGVAVRKALPAVVIARMLVNLAIDAGIGAIPVLGDVFDLFFKANRRNLALLNARHTGRRSTPGDWIVVVGSALLFLAALAAPLVILVWIIQALV